MFSMSQIKLISLNMYNNKVEKNGIKRKRFFVYLGASVIGIYAAFSNPMRIFSKKNNSSASGKLKVQQNPLAVKRNYKS